MAKRASRKTAKTTRKGAAKRLPAKPATPAKHAKPTKTRLLAGGNPQIAKGEGDAPVQAYIAAIPGWKRDVARRLDAMIVRTVPNVRKAVKWNSPLYGAADQVTTGKTGSWFLGIHCFDKYIKVAFFRGTSLRPMPPGESKQKEVRYLDIHEGEWGTTIDEAQVSNWFRQASLLPGERM